MVRQTDEVSVRGKRKIMAYTFESLKEMPNGQYGPFIIATFSGKSYSIFDKENFAFVRSLSPGDQVEFQYATKGKYNNITSFLQKGSPSAPAQQTPKKPDRFDGSPTSMVSSYVKDLLASGVAKTVDEGVKMVSEIFDKVSRSRDPEATG